MHDIALAVVAVLAGLLFCFRGYWALRVVIAIWGAFVGFSLGAALVAAVTGDSFLATALGWIVACVLAVAMAGLGYLYYAIAVVVTMASAGFSVGAGTMLVMDSSWTWLPILVGVGVGAVVAAATLLLDLPMILLIVVSALAGASAVVTGAMLMFGSITTDDFDSDLVLTRIEHEGWWGLLAIVLAAAGVAVQASATSATRSARQAWTGSTPRHSAAPVRHGSDHGIDP